MKVSRFMERNWGFLLLLLVICAISLFSTRGYLKRAVTERNDYAAQIKDTAVFMSSSADELDSIAQDVRNSGNDELASMIEDRSDEIRVKADDVKTSVEVDEMMREYEATKNDDAPPSHAGAADF